MDIGYIRVSSVGQNTERQLQGLQLEKVFTDHVSGKDKNRPALQTCLDFVREGDILHVHSIDRLARNLKDLLDILAMLRAKGVTITFHKENLTFTHEDTPFQQLHLHIVGAVAEFERALIRERQLEGIELAKRSGKYKGRKRMLDAAGLSEVKQRLASGISVAVLAREYGVSRMTIYRWKEM